MRPTTTPRAFLLEDVHSDRVLLSGLLQGIGIAVDGSSANLEEALRMLAADPRAYDVLVVDLNLPDSEGLATLQAVVTTHPTVPVLVVTGDEEAATRAVLAGAEDVVLKDRAATDLTPAITKILQRASRPVDVTRRMGEAGFATADAPLAVVGRDGRGLLPNARLSEMVMPELLANGTLADLFHPEDRDDVVQTLQDLGQTLDGSAWTEARLLTVWGPALYDVRLRQIQVSDLCSVTLTRAQD